MQASQQQSMDLGAGGAQTGSAVSSGFLQQDAFDRYADAQWGPDAGNEGTREPESKPEGKEPARDATQPDEEGGAEGTAADESQSGERHRAEPGREEGGEEVESLDDFLKSNDLDKDAFLKMKVSMKIDGVDRQVQLDEVLANYNIASAAHERMRAASQARQEFEAQRQQTLALLQQQAQVNEQLGQAAFGQLLSEFNSVDWKSLRENNPVEFSLKRQEFTDKQQQIQMFIQQAHQQLEAQNAQAEALRQQALPHEAQRMLEVRQEWRDSSRFAKERQQMLDYAQKMGFTQQELNSIYDHRLMLILSDATRYASLQAAKPETVRQVRAKPKILPGGARRNADRQSAMRQNAAQALKRNPRDPDAQAAYFETLI